MRCSKCDGDHIQVCVVQISEDGAWNPWRGKVFCSFCGETVVVDEYFATIEQAVEAAVARWEGENSGS